MPLFILAVITALEAFCLMWSGFMGIMNWTRFFMGLLFCQFAMLKLFHLSQFANGFQMYDWIAKNFRGYAYIYPFIELGLGLSYLFAGDLFTTNLITMAIAAIGAFGVLRAMRGGLDIRCACMGTVLDVPLSTVTLTEDIGMGVMALAMLIL